MKKIFVILAISLWAVGMVAQGTYSVDVSSFGQYNMVGKRCYIASGNSAVPESDPEFKIYRDMIAQCLFLNRALPTIDENDADVYLLLDYGLADKSYVAQVTSPSWSVGYVYPVGPVLYSGYSQRTEEVQSCHRIVNLYAYDNRHRDGKPQMLWKINAFSDGTENDLLKVFPYIVAVMNNFIGVDTHGKQQYTISENDNLARMIKEGHFLAHNIIASPRNSYQKENPTLEILAVSLFVNDTRVELLENIKSKQVPTYIPQRTYLILKGERYHISKVSLPYEDPYYKDINYVGRFLPRIMESYAMRAIYMDFPIEVNAGDTIELVAYKNRKETKTAFHFRNVVL